MKMRTLLAAVSVGVVIAATPAQACKCPVVPRDRVIATTPVVFDGEVLRAEIDEAGTQVVATFRVHGAVKGVPHPRPREQLRRRAEQTVTVISSLHDADCGWDFRQGPQRLTVGATREGSNLIATRCIIYNLNSTIILRR